MGLKILDWESASLVFNTILLLLSGVIGAFRSHFLRPESAIISLYS